MLLVFSIVLCLVYFISDYQIKTVKDAVCTDSSGGEIEFGDYVDSLSQTDFPEVKFEKEDDNDDCLGWCKTIQKERTGGKPITGCQYNKIGEAGGTEWQCMAISTDGVMASTAADDIEKGLTPITCWEFNYGNIFIFA